MNTTTRSSVLSFVSAQTMTTLAPADLADLEAQVIQAVNAEMGAALLGNPTPDVRQRAEDRARHQLTRLLAERKFTITVALENQIIQTLLHKLLGYGFLEPLLPPLGDNSEIMLNQDGGVWIIPRGASAPQRVEGLAPTPSDAFTVIGKILAAVNRRATEAEPIVAAKLPRTERLPAGARVNVVAPPVANGAYPVVNIRLYESEPVRAEKLVTWGALSPALFAFLSDAIQKHLRVMICGGTGSGKTTLLSAVGNFIPQHERVILVEDPAEIFLDHPHVVSMEARPPSLDGKYGVALGDLVTTAMRQTPKWLVVGEVRTGQAAIWLLRAQMSDHPGLSTIHAYSPQAAVETLCLLAMLDMGIKFEATKTLIARAIDLFVQIEYVGGTRRVTRIAQVGAELQRGEVGLDDLWRFDPAQNAWAQLKELTRTR